jgi:hypothetical protein
MSSLTHHPKCSGAGQFTSAKTAGPIPITSSVIGDLLVQATLDPAVRRIEFIKEQPVRGRAAVVDALVFSFDDGRKVVEVAEMRQTRSIDDEGLFLLAVEQLGLGMLTVTAAEIAREPRAGNSRLVWACRRWRVAAGDRVRILHVLSEEREMALPRVAAHARFSSDPVAAVLALACADLVEADLETIPLGPETRIRRRIHEENP